MGREQLYELVDALPEGALEAARGILKRLQEWPPPSSPDLDRIRQQQLERMRQSTRPGAIGSCISGGISGPDGHAHYSVNRRMDDGTSVMETHHIHAGHEVTVIERLWLAEGRRLGYAHEITGPNGKTQIQEIGFEVGTESD